MIRRQTTTTAAFAIPTAANLAVVAVQLLAVAACLVGAAHVRGPWAVAGLAVAFAVVMNSVYSTVHEAEHAMLLPNRTANDAAGAVLALLFPGPFHLLRQGHLGHHLRNRSDDEAFDLYFDGDNRLWRWLCWVGILTGGFYLLVYVSNAVAAVYPWLFDRRHYKLDRASAAFAESFNPSHRWLIWAEGVAVVGLHVAILRVVPAWHYVAVYAAFGFTWSAMQYVHHFGTERHVTRGARNLFLFAPIDAVWLNHNWHRNHHEHPTVPWVYLPTLGRDPAVNRRGFLPLFYLRMWRGPWRTAEHVENRYAGRIIQ